MFKIKKLEYASDGTPQIRGVTFAHLSRKLQMTVLTQVAAGRVKFIDQTMEQLAAIGGVSTNKLLKERRQVGAPIRLKRPAARKVDPAPEAEPANVDIVGALRRLGSRGLLKVAKMVERDELTRAAVAAKANGNGAALKSGAHHTV